MRGPHGLESDVWSLGCMLYTMLVGRPPFDVSIIGLSYIGHNYVHGNAYFAVDGWCQEHTKQSDVSRV